MEADEESGETPGGAPSGIAVCAGEGSLRRRIRDVLLATGQPVVLADDVDELLVSVQVAPAPPSCVILAGPRPDTALGEAASKVHALVPTAPIVVVSRRAGAGDVRRAIGFGVDGVVLERRIEESLGPVVDDVRSGQTSVPSARRTEIGPEVLTKREKQVLSLVAGGLSNAEMAAELYLAESTVKSHLSSAFGKLNVSSRHEAASLILDPERGRSLGIPLAEERQRASVQPDSAEARTASAA